MVTELQHAPTNPAIPRLVLRTTLVLALLTIATSGLLRAQESDDGQDVELYDHVVRPLLMERCGTCHGESRQRADLRFDTFEALQLGSEFGPVVVPGRPLGSALIQALHLPEEHERRMPPAPRPALGHLEVELLTWWVREGAKERDRLPLEELPQSLADSLRMALANHAAAQAPSEPAAVTDAGEAEAAAMAEATDASATGLSQAQSEHNAKLLGEYTSRVVPILENSCLHCHGAEEQSAGLRLDHLDPDFLNGPDAENWHVVLDMVQGASMPPATEPPLSDDDRRALVGWLNESLQAAARAKEGAIETVVRRLNREQYTHTLQDLLGLTIDFGQVLPGDAKSKRGFTNDGSALTASPLWIEYLHKIAREALDQAIFVGERPEATRYRVTFGRGIGVGKVAGKTGGYQSVPVEPTDFTVEILDSDGVPREGVDADERARLDAIRRKISVGLRGSSQSRFRIVDEGMMLYGALPHREKAPKSWQGPSPNLKLEMQRVFPEVGDFVMRVRASRGYLLNSDRALLIELEERVPLVSVSTEPVDRAADGEEETWQVHMQPGTRVFVAADSDERQNVKLDGDVLRTVDVPKASNCRFQFQLNEPGYFQLDLVHPYAPPEAMPSVRLTANNVYLDHRFEWSEEDAAQEHIVTALGAAYLPAGRVTLKVGGSFFVGFGALALTPLEEGHPVIASLEAKDEEEEALAALLTPSLRAFVGTRTDDGMDYQTFGEVVEVDTPLGEAETYTFHGRLENLPIPEPESGDTEVLSGFALFGIWNDHLVYSGKDSGPPVLIEAIEVEAPYFEQWPPESHRRIFFDSPLRELDRGAYTREVIARFLRRAYRRDIADWEVDRSVEFWREVRHDFDTYEDGVRETLVSILCSPNFLYMAEPEVALASVVGSGTPAVVPGSSSVRADAGEKPSDRSAASGRSEHPADAEADTHPPRSLGESELAARLSYFLWNSMPDAQLAGLARQGRLRANLADEVERMLEDPRAERFIRTFAREWLRMDRHESMTINADRHPRYTRFVKRDMAEETVHFLLHVLREELPLATLVDSDFAMLNENLANFYGVDGVQGQHFRPVPVPRELGRGGLLSQGAFLAGHSDGMEPHPIKRAVWLKEKILGEHIPAPPPNVPDLDPETPGFDQMTLREQLDAHRDNPSCYDCHAGIDPYGVVFEHYSAVGLLEQNRKGRPIDASTTLPDGTEVANVAELKSYLQSGGYERVAHSVIEHLFIYALGRNTSFADADTLARLREEVRARGDTLRGAVHAIVSSEVFGER